jgi:hypothetical protein
MKIGINLVGVSYNDGTNGRYRNYEDALLDFEKWITNPLKSENEVNYYLASYNSDKVTDIIETYKPKKYKFDRSELNNYGGGDLHDNGTKLMTKIHIESLQNLQNEDLDFVISTRFDIAFNETPKLDFDKFNFLFREPVYTELPLVSDCFYAFPMSMLNSVIEAMHEMETNPFNGVSIGMHNLYQPLQQSIGNANINVVYDDFMSSADNRIFTLTRKEK